MASMYLTYYHIGHNMIGTSHTLFFVVWGNSTLLGYMYSISTRFIILYMTVYTTQQYVKTLPLFYLRSSSVHGSYHVSELKYHAYSQVVAS